MAADFTAGPLYSLLSSVDNEQRVLYISQLKAQYDKCDSESERFGILKLLLPTVTAVQDMSVVEETLKPIVLESFQVDSMVSTESIALIVAALAERIALSLDKDETDFSIDLLQLLLSELVSAVQTEVDLVELDPVSFIDSQLGDMNEWNTIKEQAMSDEPSNQLDLECCLDTLNLILQYVQNDNVWVDIIGLVAISLISCTDATLRTKAVNEVISSLYYRQENANKKTNICQMLWERTCGIFFLPATNLLRSEVYGLTARFFDHYFELNHDTGLPMLDLRLKDQFWQLIQAGLKSKDSAARKYAVYIFKRVIDLTTKITTPTNIQWTHYFQWEDDKSQAYQNLYEEFFLLYDIMHENVLHLVDPILPRFELLLFSSDPAIDPSWWTLLLYRGFQNEAMSVRKRILEYVFGFETKQSLLAVAKQYDFLFGVFFAAIDTTSLYTVSTLGAMVSPTGEMLRGFIRKLIEAVDDGDEKITLIQQLIHHVAFVMTSFIAMMYVTEALTDVAPCKAFGPEELKSVRVLVDKNMNFQKQNAKVWMRRLCMQAVFQLSNVSTLAFMDVAKTINSLVNRYPMAVDSIEFNFMEKWIKQFEEEHNDKAESQLAEKTKDFVEEPISESDSLDSIQNQANIISRVAMFNPSANSQFAPLIERLQELFDKEEIENTSLTKVAILLVTSWSDYDSLYEGDGAGYIGLNSELCAKLIEKVEPLYLEDNVDVEIAQIYGPFYAKLTELILMSDSLSPSLRSELLVKYVQNSKIMIKNSSEKTFDKETLKMNYLLVTGMSFTVAKELKLQGLFSDVTELIAPAASSRLKRTPDFQSFGKTWGSLVDEFISRKWNCISAIIEYLQINDKAALESLDAQDLYDNAVDELEVASESCGIPIMKCIQLLIALPFEKSLEMIQPCVDHALEMINASSSQSNTFPKITAAVIDMVFQEELLAKPELNEDDGHIKKAFHKIFDWGDLRPYIVTQMASNYYQFWAKMSEISMVSLQQYKSEFIQLLMYGPIRYRDDQKMDGALLLKSTTLDEIAESEGTAELSFSFNDYVVRVQMNILLIKLDETVEAHRHFAESVLDELLALASSEKYTHLFVYVNQIEHRCKLRMVCAIMLLQRFITENNVEKYLKLFFECLKKETMVSIRSYLEWAMVRMLSKFPSRFSFMYTELQYANPKAHVMISLITVTMFVGQVIPSQELPAYIDKTLAYLLPWLTSNHHTIRLIAQCALRRIWLRYKDIKATDSTGESILVANQRTLETLYDFLESNSDTVRFREKLEESYYFSEFDTEKDFNLDFIFRQLPTVFNISESERIGTRAFLKVDPQVADLFPMINPERTAIKASAGSLEELLANDTVSVDNRDEASFQKKIMPWEMMLESDIDLTKSLVRHNRRRNDLIVVASLIDRLPNLAGLCRTCEIFNAGLLTVHNLKIKDDQNFLGISVSSEKWMPMKEVTEPDVAAFLNEKKSEGYLLCGLEQTTTSTPLQEFDFPRKCVLLLGKEKEGIPAHLLQMLDHTIEIPQFGITRSLNVHVSASICIYEYTKRQLNG
ncbi:hypothetical protein BGW37DRAFT_488649 [Umbelopsis sp. PMI_123]|nr:hypothetical protein BGW37DRAFT_488649 [Umbelopsis sp. PMI_123]